LLSAGRVNRAHNIDDLRRLARKRLPKVCFDFIEGGGEDEVTLADNVDAFKRLTLLPRSLSGAEKMDQRTVVLGTELSTPVILAPVGLPRIVSRNADLDAARAAGAAGTVYCVPTGATVSLEEIAGVATGPLWFQLYLWKKREVYEGLVLRAQALGFKALVVTVDSAIASKRERDLRNGFTLPLRLSLADRLEAVRHPRWVWNYLTGPEITFGNLSGIGKGATTLAELVNKELNNPGASWADLERLRDLWTGPLLVKGVLTPDDARRAVACGADGIVVSNHGGRQRDTVPASSDVLPEIVAAVDSGTEVLLDSGVRRGTDVIKALALGAKAVMVGRAYMWGLAAADQTGAARALEILRHEIDIAQTLLGRPTLADLDPSVVGRVAARQQADWPPQY
jgi:isopentenyl diphosphate isomerase/L-lactate dehydrogenase-like FMN-dependent dehydrogenase